MIDQSELNPNQFPAWAEFTPSSESLTKVSARDGFQIDLGNPLTLEDLTLASLGVSGLTTLHDLDIKDASETVILQRNGSTIETLIDTVSGGVTTKAMARIGAGIIESGTNSYGIPYDKFGNGSVYCTATKPAIQITNYFASAGIKELCRIAFTNLGVCARITLFATRGNYVVVGTWLITTGHASGLQATKQNGTYIVPTLIIDVDNYSTAQFSIDFGAAQGFALTVESYGADPNFAYLGTAHASPDSGYARYTS